MINQILLEERQNLVLPEEYRDLEGQKLLVTGAAGFIGGDLFKRLTEYGLDVVGTVLFLSLIHISEPTRPPLLSRMPSSA